MKKLIIFSLLALVLIVGGLFAYALYNANALISSFRPQIEKTASDALGSKVTLGEIDTTLFPDTRFTIKNVQVSAEAAAPLKLDNVELRMRLLPLLSGRLEVTKLSIIKPVITLLKSKEGMAVEGLPRKTGGTEPRKSSPKETSAESPSSPVALSLKDFEISDGLLEVKDIEQKKSWQIKRCDVSASISLEGKSLKVERFESKGNALSAADFSISGNNLEFGLANGELRVGRLFAAVLGNSLDISGQFDTRSSTGAFAIQSTEDGLVLEKFAPIWSQFPQLDALKLKGRIKPNLKVKLAEKGNALPEGTLGLDGVSVRKDTIMLSDLKGELRIASDPEMLTLASDSLTLKVNESPLISGFSVEMPKDGVNLKKLSLSGFGGSAEASARYGLADQSFSASLSSSGLELGKMLSALAPAAPPKVSGVLHKFDAVIKGQVKDRLTDSLDGKVLIDMRDGSFAGFNLAAVVLKSIKDIPFVSGALFGSVPPEVQNEVSSDSTPIRSLTGTMQIGGGYINTRDLRMTSTIFSLEAAGRAGFDSSLDLSATILFSPQFSMALAARTKELKTLLDQQNRLVVPLAISGTPPGIIVLPDLTKLLKTGAGRVLQDKAGKALEKVLGGKGFGGLF